MKRLTCEMCGGTDIVKQDGLFVCQSCGVKYSLEEAKKMMITGVVNVTGTVRVDTSTELRNLYELARRAKTDGNSEKAQKYYDQIVVKDPSSWEANFYTTYFQSRNCKVQEVKVAAVRISNCEDTVLTLIKENVSDPEERRNAIDEVATQSIAISKILFNAYKNYYDGLEIQKKLDKKDLIQANLLQL